MKTKVEIWEGDAKIVLTPENEFEKDLIEKSKTKFKFYEIGFHVKEQYYQDSEHKIEISLTEET